MLNLGSSPLARGTPQLCKPEVSPRRFIPAGAGNTRIWMNRVTKSPVHPRWRGEHKSRDNHLICMRGSSPLARGTHHYQKDQRCKFRFIPAGAGNTSNPCDSRFAITVHPRWRGEHRGASPRFFSSRGSSPLARGTRSPDKMTALSRRFIPADAGNTASSCELTRHQAVHPRWRGEHLSPGMKRALNSGSSPLARGTPLSGCSQSGWPRFIPAGAGNTPLCCPAVKASTVHPRWRGEHGVMQRDLVALLGSSPLARGTRAGALRISQP